jgi:glycosyltransferase A (GT-A) superfamily protein (DUF2064 family)
MSEINKRAECAIAIMAQAPYPCEVKTRLCPPLSYEEAAQFYHCFLLDKIRSSSRWHFSRRDERGNFHGNFFLTI